MLLILYTFRCELIPTDPLSPVGLTLGVYHIPSLSEISVSNYSGYLES